MKIARPGPRRASAEGYLDGQLLIAMPVMSDPRFARSVIYLCAHSEDGAMGLIINQRASHISFPDLLERLGIVAANGEETALPTMSKPVDPRRWAGRTGRGFVLHSADYFVDDSTLPIEGGVCLTATIDILKAIAAGSGPNRAILALGYAGWSPGQLESEIQANGWLNCPADPDLIFDPNLEAKYSTRAGQDRHRSFASRQRRRPRLTTRRGVSPRGAACRVTARLSAHPARARPLQDAAATARRQAWRGSRPWRAATRRSPAPSDARPASRRFLGHCRAPLPAPMRVWRVQPVCRLTARRRLRRLQRLLRKCGEQRIGLERRLVDGGGSGMPCSPNDGIGSSKPNSECAPLPTCAGGAKACGGSAKCSGGGGELNWPISGGGGGGGPASNADGGGASVYAWCGEASANGG